MVAGETVNVTILPLTGQMTATPNPTPTPKTGSLVLSLPSSNWNLGTLAVAGLPLENATSKYCGLNSDSVVITFEASSDTTLHLYFDQGSPDYSFFVNGKKVQYLRISGMSYSAKTRVLSFGSGAAWNCHVGGPGTLAINTTSNYPGQSSFVLGKMVVKQDTLQPGLNNLCVVTDTVKIQFVNYPDRAIWVYPGGSSPNFDIRVNGQKVDTLSITGLSYDPGSRSLNFPSNAKWKETSSCTSTSSDAVTILLPSDYPSAGMGSITYNAGADTVKSTQMYYCDLVTDRKVSLGLTTGYTISLTTENNSITIYKVCNPSEDDYYVAGMV